MWISAQCPYGTKGQPPRGLTRSSVCKCIVFYPPSVPVSYESQLPHVVLQHRLFQTTRVKGLKLYKFNSFSDTSFSESFARNELILSLSCTIRMEFWELNPTLMSFFSYWVSAQTTSWSLTTIDLIRIKNKSRLDNSNNGCYCRIPTRGPWHLDYNNFTTPK